MSQFTDFSILLTRLAEARPELCVKLATGEFTIANRHIQLSKTFDSQDREISWIIAGAVKDAVKADGLRFDVSLNSSRKWCPNIWAYDGDRHICGSIGIQEECEAIACLKAYLDWIENDYRAIGGAA